MLRVKLLTTKAKVPTVGHPGEDLGYDLYADLENNIPDSKWVGESEDRSAWIAYPQAITPVPTGISIEFQPKSGGLILTRSSMAKKGLIVVGGVIDAGYRGEIIVMLANLTNVPIVIKHGEKIAQLVKFPFMAEEAQPVADLSEAVRGQMGFGSTGK